MKKTKFTGKLKLNKEKISNLNANEMENIIGGATDAAAAAEARKSRVTCYSIIGNCDTESCNFSVCIKF